MAQEKQPDIAASLGRAAGRLSSDKALRKRLLRAGMSGAQTTLSSVGRVLRKLWHEITGFLFICLALIGGAEVARKWQTHETQKLAAAAVFSVMFLYFGVSSFWRAKRSHRRGAEKVKSN
jgi:hypothetical protein